MCEEERKDRKGGERGTRQGEERPKGGREIGKLKGGSKERLQKEGSTRGRQASRRKGEVRKESDGMR